MINLSLIVFTAATIWGVFYFVPPAEGLGGLVRIAFFHIPVAWVSVLAFFLSAWWAFRYLQTSRLSYDSISSRSAAMGFVFCLCATISGAVFAKLTWGAYWNWDPRQITIFILLFIYGAYFALRSSIVDRAVKAKLSAIYSLFSCAAVPFLVFVIPRYYFSLHPEPLLNKNGSIQMDSVMILVLLICLCNITCIFFRVLYRRKDMIDE
ncbi:cytochrome c biogenesis protein [Propionispira raffinosivorans]|uniref:cytochrome c biogenesis protein n=1 Tax=Propionispira raffinosivorans TaxID=86959 RepID=UPI0003745D91|nr:cytochrome c biogenesis protein CcsA [Propionispira raffinosivorans]